MNNETLNNEIILLIDKVLQELRELDEMKLMGAKISNENFENSMNRIQCIKNAKIKQLETLICSL